MVRSLRHIGVNLGIGTGAAFAFVGGLFALDVARLRTLVVAEGDMTAPLLLLVGFVITFGSIAMGVAIMAMGREPTHGGGPPRRRRVGTTQVQALAPARGRR